MDQHTIWWIQHQLEAEAVAANEEMMEAAEKDCMFEKTLTPSDVGKLNRLVIPKQHAERYFPLGGGSGSNSGVDSENSLSFEDESGRCWKFRYSYWNSSQSYVLTKGWSRYVKEKALDDGDVVVFWRLRANINRKFIGFRRRMAAPTAQPPVLPRGPRVLSLAHTDAYGETSSHPYQIHCLNPGDVVPTGTTPNNGKSKIFRLFGVNVEYEPNTSQCDVSELSQSETRYEQYSTSNGHAWFAHNYMCLLSELGSCKRSSGPISAAA